MSQTIPYSKPIVIVDVETTGGSAATNRLIEIGIIRIENGKELKVKARIRYRQELQSATVYQFEKGVYVSFDEPQSAITSGQFVAWYIEDELVGSGVIS